MNSSFSYQDQVSTGFSRVIKRATMTDADHSGFATHADRAKASVAAGHRVTRFEVMGSYSRGSGMKGVSDLDLLVVLDPSEITWGGSRKSSSTVLDNVRSSLAYTFHNTDLGRDGQAIVLRFSDGRNIDVVPAWESGVVHGGFARYEIPDGNGGWMRTAPGAHAEYISRGEAASGRKLKSVVKILKYWKESRSLSLPLSAFHLELLLTKEGTCGPGKSLSACTADALALLHQRGCRALQDPCGISGHIHAAGTESKRERLFNAVNASYSYAARARMAEVSGNVAEAVRYWDLAFNGAFA